MCDTYTNNEVDDLKRRLATAEAKLAKADADLRASHTAICIASDKIKVLVEALERIAKRGDMTARNALADVKPTL